VPKGLQGFQKGHKAFKGCEKTWFKKGERTSPATEFKKGQFSGDKNYFWKSGRSIMSNGYILVKKPNHPFSACNGYILEHRLVMEKMIGRYLTPEERVHHRGIKYSIGSIENKQDNRPENLKLFADESKHQIFHNHAKKNSYLILQPA